jgi:hypothetical protein
MANAGLIFDQRPARPSTLASAAGETPAGQPAGCRRYTPRLLRFPSVQSHLQNHHLFL